MRALVVDDDDFTRFLLVRTLHTVGADHILDCATSAEALRMVSESVRVDLAILDLDLGSGPTGIDLAYGLRRQMPAVAVIILSSYSDPRLLGANRDLPHGAVYLSKRELSDADTLRDVIHEVLEVPLGRRGGAPTARAGDGRRLSDNQVDVMRLIAEGYSNAEIGRRRSLTEAAVEKAIARLIRQLDLRPTKEDNARVLIIQAYYALIGATQIRRE
jgi:DNA-binding NarL/FixJ family response regulator